MQLLLEFLTVLYSSEQCVEGFGTGTAWPKTILDSGEIFLIRQLMH
jgi:hypothetical protein